MTDLVEWLRNRSRNLDVPPQLRVKMDEAATALETKAKELAALRETVEHLNWGVESLRSEAADWNKQYVELQSRAETAERQLSTARKALGQQTQVASEQFCRANDAERERDEAREALQDVTEPITHFASTRLHKVASWTVMQHIKSQETLNTSKASLETPLARSPLARS